MSDDKFTTFDKRPTEDEAPDECQQRGCSKKPDKTVRWWNPKEWVCYCNSCANELMDDTDARRKKDLR